MSTKHREAQHAYLDVKNESLCEEKEARPVMWSLQTVRAGWEDNKKPKILL